MAGKRGGRALVRRKADRPTRPIGRHKSRHRVLSLCISCTNLTTCLCVRLFQIRHRFGCYDQVTEVNRLRVRYCNWVRFLKITQHHSEQHVNVLGTKIKGTRAHRQPVRHTFIIYTCTRLCTLYYTFLFHRNTFLLLLILLFIFIHDDYAIIRVSRRTCSGFNTVCGFMGWIPRV